MPSYTTIIFTLKKARRYLLFAFVLLLAFALLVVFLTQKEIDMANKLIAISLQFLGLAILLLFLVTVARWIIRPASGTVILPFEVPAKCSHTSNSIIETLLAERYRLLHIEEYENESEMEQEDQEEPIEPKGKKPGKAPTSQIKAQSGNSFTKKEAPEIETSVQKNDPTMANVTIGVGGTSFSLGEILVNLKRLWKEHDPETTISGWLQEKGSGYALVVKKVSKTNKQNKTWQIEGDDLSSIIREMAFRMVNESQDVSENEYSYKLYKKANEDFKKIDPGQEQELMKFRTKLFECIRDFKVIKKPPKLLHTLYILYFNKRDFKQAAEICNSIIEIKSKFSKPFIANTYNNLGVCLDMADETIVQALDAFYKAAQFDPQKCIYYYNLTLTYKKLEAFPGLNILAGKEKLFQLIDEAKGRNLVDLEDPQSIFLGDWYADLGFQEEAKTAYETAIKIYPKNVVLQYHLANTLSLLGEKEKAIAQFQKTIQLAETTQLTERESNETLANIYHDMAYTWSTYGPDEGGLQAKTTYIKALSFNPGLAISHLNLGMLYEQTQDFEVARDFYWAAYQLEPNSPRFATTLALLYDRFDLFDQAIAVLQPIIEKYKDDADLHAQLAFIYCDADNLDDAVNEYLLAIDLYPDNYFYYTNLGYTYIGKKEFSKAIDALNNCLRLNEKNRYAWASLAAAYKKMGQPENYQVNIEKALQLDPIGGEDDYNQASFEALCGRTTEALAYLKAAFEKKLHTRAFVKRDWDFDFIRDDPGFQRLLTSE